MKDIPIGHHLLLMRHGETAWSRDGRYQGRSDPPLSPEGIAHSNCQADGLRNAGVRHIVTSPLLRARQTAEVIAAALGLDAPEIDPSLAELAYGQWEGLTQSEVKARWPALLRRWKQAPETVRFPGGETLDELRTRVRDGMAARKVQAESTPVLLVTHAAWIRLALIEAGGLPLGEFRRIAVETGSVHRLSAWPLYGLE